MSFSGEKTFINVLPSRNRISCLFFGTKHITRAKHELHLHEAPISLAEGEYHCEAVLALSPVKIKIPVASADMRRHSDTLKAANAAMKERFTGRKQPNELPAK